MPKPPRVELISDELKATLGEETMHYHQDVPYLLHDALEEIRRHRNKLYRTQKSKKRATFTELRLEALILYVKLCARVYDLKIDGFEG